MKFSLSNVQTLRDDVLAVLKTMYGDSPPAIVLVGHRSGSHPLDSMLSIQFAQRSELLLALECSCDARGSLSQIIL